MERILIVGTCGSGKTTLGAQLGRQLNIPVHDIDELYWGPNWTPRPQPEFHADIERAIATPQWIITGNYTSLRGLLCPQATTIIWLNYSFPLIFSRLFSRSVSRIITRKEMFGGCHETFWRTFCSHDSIFVWLFKTFRKRRREYGEMRAEGTYPQLEWIEFRHPRQADEFLASLGSAAATGAVRGGNHD